MNQEELLKTLENIRAKFEEVEQEFNKIPNEIQEEILNYHSSFSLNSIVRWASQNTDELIFGIEEISK